MKKSILWVAGLALVMASCNNENDALQPQSQDGRVAMDVRTSVQQSRAMVSDIALAEGSEIGVTLVEMPEEGQAHGDTYDGLGNADGYWNVLYTAGVEEGDQIWTSTEPIMLSSTLGQAVAYYPYSSTQSNYKALAVTADGQTDYLYSEWEDADGINNAAPTTTFTMKHALSAVKLTFKRGTYTYTGEVSAATINSAGFGVTGSLDASTGDITGVTPSVDVTTAMNPEWANLTIPETVGETTSTILMVVPVQDYTVVDNNLPMNITATIDGKQYTLTGTMTEKFQAGNIYNFELTLDNTALEVTQVTVTPWEENATASGGTLNPSQN